MVVHKKKLSWWNSKLVFYLECLVKYSLRQRQTFVLVLISIYWNWKQTAHRIVKYIFLPIKIKIFINAPILNHVISEKMYVLFYLKRLSPFCWMMMCHRHSGSTEKWKRIALYIRWSKEVYWQQMAGVETYLKKALKV